MLILIVFCILAGFYYVDPELAKKMFWFLGISWGQEPYYDTFSPLSWLECHRQGIKVYYSNPCDTRLGMEMSYPPAWLAFSGFGIGTAHAVILGTASGLAFCMSCMALPRPQTLAAAACLALTLCSNAVLFGLHQGNFDLVVFAMAVLFVHAMQRSLGTRKAAYIGVIGLSVLKFYPLFLAILVAREPLRWVLFLLGGVTMAALTYAASAPEELAATLAWMPRGRPLEMFGFGNAENGLRLLLDLPERHPGLAIAVTTAFFMATSMIGLHTASLLVRIDARTLLTPLERDFLVAGAALIVGCFLAGQSWRYKAIFLILAVVPLATLAGRARLATARIVFSAAVVAVLVALWGVFLINAAKHADIALGLQRITGIGLLRAIAWSLQEVAWWGIIGVLGGCLAWWATAQPAVLALRRTASWTKVVPGTQAGYGRTDRP